VVITITSRSTKAEIEAALKALEDAKNKNTDSKMKPFDAHKYCGIITLRICNEIKCTFVKTQMYAIRYNLEEEV